MTEEVVALPADAGGGRDVALGWRLIDALVSVRRAMRPERFGAARPYLMVLPALLFVSIFAAGLLYLLWSSFHGFDTFRARQGGVSIEQYRRIVEPPSGTFYRGVLVRTFTISTLVTLASVPLGLPVAYLIVRVRSQGLRALSLVLLLAPYLMGEAVRAFGWAQILGPNGAVSWAVSLFGAGWHGLLGTNLSIWLGLMQVSIPLAALIALPAVRRIDPQLERAAETLGARPWRVWWHVIAPLARPGMLAGAAIVFLLAVAELDMPQIVGLGRVPFVANIIQQVYELQGNLNLGAALAVTVLALSLGLLAMLFVGGRALSRLGRRA